MRIKTVHLRNYKRFTDLRIGDLPEDVRLVVLIGPNGSGKSSLFDAFLHKAHGTKNNLRLSGEYSGYYVKDETQDRVPTTTHDVWQRINIELHSFQPNARNWSKVFNVRSAYRNESDFQVEGIQRTTQLSESVRFRRIIDTELSVADNYRRLAWKRMADLDFEASDEMTFGAYRRESLGELQRAMRSCSRNLSYSLVISGERGISARSASPKGQPMIFSTRICQAERRRRSIFC